MKFRAILLHLLFLLANCATMFRYPFDEYGNPIVISMPLRTDTLDGYMISPGYYTISNNIENPKSSVYISKHPTEMQLVKFAQNLPSYNFIIHVGQNVKSMVMLNQICNPLGCEFSYHIIIPSINYSYYLPSKIPGQITQLRATELCYQGYDSTASIDTIEGKPYCQFKGHQFLIQPYQEILAEVKEIVKKEKLYD